MDNGCIIIFESKCHAILGFVYIVLELGEVGLLLLQCHCVAHNKIGH